MIELHDNEEIVLMRRKHWFVLASHLLPVAVLFFLPGVLFSALGSIAGFKETIARTEFADPRIAVFASALWMLVLWIAAFIVWTDYYLDVWIITNKRIIDIEQKGFFAREVSSFRYEQIQDITVTINGLIPTLLNFGTLHVQTAGSSPKLEIRGVAYPNQLRDLISDKLDIRVDHHQNPV